MNFLSFLFLKSVIRKKNLITIEKNLKFEIHENPHNLWGLRDDWLGLNVEDLSGSLIPVPCWGREGTQGRRGHPPRRVSELDKTSI